jgi:hypothetical protein
MGIIFFGTAGKLIKLSNQAYLASYAKRSTYYSLP